MGNEIINGGGGLVSIAGGNELADAIKPLKRDIHLFDTYIAGTTHVDEPEALDQLAVDDVLSLQREDNKFDTNAIKLMSGKARVGYIPERDNLIFARLMDAGKLLTAKVKSIEKKGSFYKIAIGIYLVDF